MCPRLQGRCFTKLSPQLSSLSPPPFFFFFRHADLKFLASYWYRLSTLDFSAFPFQVLGWYWQPSCRCAALSWKSSVSEKRYPPTCTSPTLPHYKSALFLIRIVGENFIFPRKLNPRLGILAFLPRKWWILHSLSPPCPPPPALKVLPRDLVYLTDLLYPSDPLHNVSDEVPAV